MSIIGCANCGGTHYGSNTCPDLEKGKPCTVCGKDTCYCCSDCAIDGAGKVYVCVTDACRAEHEKKHPEVRPLTSVVKRSCSAGAACGWPECGCDPQVFVRDILPLLKAN